MTLFTIYRDPAGFYRILLEVDGKVEFISKKHNSRAECLKTISHIKSSSKYDSAFKLNKRDCGSWSFQLLNIKSDRLIGESQTYISKEILGKRIMAFKKYIGLASVESQVYSF